MQHLRSQRDDTLPWAKWWQYRCMAVREPREGDPFSGRCELKVHHVEEHALERGFYTPRWSTAWTTWT